MSIGTPTYKRMAPISRPSQPPRPFYPVPRWADPRRYTPPGQPANLPGPPIRRTPGGRPIIPLPPSHPLRRHAVAELLEALVGVYKMGEQWQRNEAFRRTLETGGSLVAPPDWTLTHTCDRYAPAGGELAYIFNQLYAEYWDNNYYHKPPRTHPPPTGNTFETWEAFQNSSPQEPNDNTVHVYSSSPLHPDTGEATAGVDLWRWSQWEYQNFNAEKSPFTLTAAQAYQWVFQSGFSPRPNRPPDLAWVHRPMTGASVSAPGGGRGRPPRTRKRGDDKKAVARLGRAYRVLRKLVDSVGEGIEWVDILARASGYHGPSDPVRQWNYLFREGGIAELDIGDLAQGIVDNAIEDLIYGTLGRLGGQASQKTGRLFGMQTGYAM